MLKRNIRAQSIKPKKNRKKKLKISLYTVIIIIHKEPNPKIKRQMFLDLQKNSKPIVRESQRAL